MRKRTQDIAEEIETHLTMATRERIERGMAPDEARLAALREFGNVPLIQQTTREVWSWTWLEQLLQDLRMGVRILWNAPGLSATAVLLVGLVIGGNTTIYSMVNGLLVSPASGVTAERLVGIKHVEPGVAFPDPIVSYPNYEDYARATNTIERLAAWSDERMTLGTETGNYAVFGALVTTNYFATLGARLALGRDFSAADDDAREGVVAIISDRVWEERFARDPDILGRSVRINNAAATVIGVATPGFAGAMLTPGEDVWVPIKAFYRVTGNLEVLSNRRQPLVVLVGQRAPRASIADVRAEFDGLVTQLRAAYPEGFTQYGDRGVTQLTDPRVEVTAYSIASLLPFGAMAPYFLLAFSVVTLITLIVVSANVANLMLGRAVVRQRDTAVRQSLGASRGRIIRLLVAEGATIALVSWAAACVFGWWTSRLMFQLIEPRPGLTAAIRPDWTLAAYAMVLAAVATVSFTVAPAFGTWRQPLLPLLRSGEHNVARGRSRVSNTLVVLQLAFSVLLITSAGLAYRSISLLDSDDVGFDADRLLLVTVRAGDQEAFITRSTPDDHERRRAALGRIERVREHLAGKPGVSAVSYSPRRPSGNFRGTDPVRRSPGLAAEQAFVRRVGPEYLRSLGLQPLSGRDLSAMDRPGSLRAAVISEQLARTLFGNESPLGRHIHLNGKKEPYEVVGIAPNALYDGPTHDPQPRFVFTARQQAVDEMLIDMTFYIRYGGALESATATAARAIADADSTLPVVAMETMRSRLDQVAELERQVATMLVAFAIASLVIAALGQYSVAMFNMRRRTRDFGVRLALGASSRRIQSGVVRETIALTVPGLVIGFALSVAVATVFRSVLFGITPVDPVTYVGVLSLMGATSLIASSLPAWRAGRVNVVEALRHE